VADRSDSGAEGSSSSEERVPGTERAATQPDELPSAIAEGTEPNIVRRSSSEPGTERGQRKRAPTRPPPGGPEIRVDGKPLRPATVPPPTPPSGAVATEVNNEETIPADAPTLVVPVPASMTAPAPTPRIATPRPATVPPPVPTSKRVATKPAERFTVRGVRSPLVGRDAEIESMRAALNAAVDFQAPQLISIVGNQGTGKSRLIDELIGGLAAPVRVVLARASKDGPRYHLMGRMLRHRFGIGDSDTQEQVLAKLRTEVERVFEDDRVSEVVHFLGTYLDLHFPDSPFLRVLTESPTQHEDIARTVLRRFIEVDASQSPLVMVFDDVQWAGAETLELIRELGKELRGSPLVLLAAARSDLKGRLADWGDGVTEHLRLELRNLEPADAEVMLRNLLHRCEGIPVEIVEDAVEMTGGNPAFLEQLVRLFLDNGTIDRSGPQWRIDVDKAAATELPISIEEAIEARIAALEPRERDLLEKGAVFGSVFWVGAVVSMRRIEEASKADSEPVREGLAYEWSDEGEAIRRDVLSTVAGLVDSDYLLQLDAEDSTIGGEIEVVFKHNLERELIAKSTDPERLALYHRLAAKWFETKIRERSEEQLEYLGQLYDKGGDRRRAGYCYMAGGDKALVRYANDQAMSLYSRALDRLGDDDALARLSGLHNLGTVYDRIGRTDDALKAFFSMLSLAWLYEAYGKGGAAHGRIGRIHRGHGEYDAAMDHLNRAHELFVRAGDTRGIAGCLDDIGKVHFLRGAYHLALEHHRKSLSIRRGIGDQRSIALSLANIGRVHHASGGFKAAVAQFREALDIRRGIGDQAGVVQSLLDIGGVHMADGQHAVAMEMFSEAEDIARKTGDKLARSETLGWLGECRAVSGDGSGAVEALQEAIALANELGNKVVLASCYRRLAEAWLGLGDFDQAERYCQRALQLSEELGARLQVAICHRVLGEVVASAAANAEELEGAERHLRTAVDILAGMKNELELARCYRSFSGVRERQGMSEDAAVLRQRAEEIYGRLRGAAAI